MIRTVSLMSDDTTCINTETSKTAGGDHTGTQLPRVAGTGPDTDGPKRVRQRRRGDPKTLMPEQATHLS
jgi:hypothetical protein